jgi:hypothetical protein
VLYGALWMCRIDGTDSPAHVTMEEERKKERKKEKKRKEKKLVSFLLLRIPFSFRV